MTRASHTCPLMWSLAGARVCCLLPISGWVPGRGCALVQPKWAGRLSVPPSGTERGRPGHPTGWHASCACRCCQGRQGYYESMALWPRLNILHAREVEAVGPLWDLLGGSAIWGRSLLNLARGQEGLLAFRWLARHSIELKENTLTVRGWTLPPPTPHPGHSHRCRTRASEHKHLLAPL